MKKTKLIIPAMGLLLLSTAASVTGTVAWFASQAVVTASGMSVTAKSDSAFLLIQAGAVEGANEAAKATAIQTSGSDQATAVTATAQLLPVAHELTVGTATISNVEAVTDNDPNQDTYTNWYYRYSKNAANWGSDESGMTAKQYVLDDKFASYVLVNEFNLTLAAGSNPMNTMKVDACTITTAGDQAVNVLVATATASEEFSGTGGSGSTTLQASLTSSTIMQVKVYIYWNGNDTDVYTNGIADLQSTSVSLTFTGIVGAAA